MKDSFHKSGVYTETHLHIAWAIILIKYNNPENLMLMKQPQSFFPIWTCGNITERLNVLETLYIFKANIDEPICNFYNRIFSTITDMKYNMQFIPFHRSHNSEIEVGNAIVKILELDRKYNGHLHPEILPERFIGHFKKILNAALSNSSMTIRDVEILLPEERKKILDEFNQTRRKYPRESTIHELFSQFSRNSSDRIAIVCDNVSVTYGELDRKSNSLAHTLRSRGIEKGSIVAIAADRSIEIIISIFATLKSGAAYLPIDTQYPEEHIRQLLSESAARLFITKCIEGKSLDIEQLDPYNLSSYDDDESDLPSSTSPLDLAYVIYTSGTTGIPKGVMIWHRGVVNLSCWFNDKYDIQKNPHVLQSTSLTFDVSIEQIFGTLLNGGTLFLIKKELLLHKSSFHKFIKKYQIHLIQLVPSILNLLSEDPMLESVRIVTSGGELLKQELKDRMLEQGYKLYNHYGPTETTVDAIVSECEEGAVTLGKPIFNTRIYILNEVLQLCPIGVAGQICISGDGLALGYLHRELLTKEKFIPNPYEPGSLMYCTGDLGSWLNDGRIDYLGRIDDQLKINGIRIHPEEIRKHLIAHPAIKEALVIGVVVNDCTKVCVYYTTNLSVSGRILREYLMSKIPQFMVPNKYVELSHIPLNSNGKINRHALPKITD